MVNPQNVLNQIDINENYIVADFGAGTGRWSEILAKRVTNGRVYLIDVDSAILDRVRTNFNEKSINNVEFIVSDLVFNGSRLKDNYLDLVIISSVLFQLEDDGEREKMINEAVRVLKKGGELVIIDWSDSFSGIGPHQNHVYTEQELLSLISNNIQELEKIKELETGQYHYGFLFRKK